MADAKKVAIKVWRPILDKLDVKFEKALLRRDAYLNRVLEIELDYLDGEVVISNSQAAFNYVAQKLDSLDRRIVSISIRNDLIDKLEDICARKLIVREAFFNRFFLMLAAKPEHIDRLLLLENDWRMRVWDKHMFDSGFFPDMYYPFEPRIDPFEVVRAGIEYSNEVRAKDGNESNPVSFYTVTFRAGIFKNTDLSGLNCYFPDSLLPDSPEQVSLRQALDDL